MIGEILALSSAFCYATAAVLYKKGLRTTGYFTTLLVSTLFAALFILMTLPITRYQSSRITFNLMALIIIAEFIGLGLGDPLYFVGLKKIGVSRTVSISSSYPLYSMILATLFLNEALTIAVIVGTPLIVVGIAIVSLSQNKESATASNSKDTLLGIVTSIVAAVFWSIALTILKVVLNSGDRSLKWIQFARHQSSST
ncbi:EamA family transporter, partial [[Eubacterium] cellulosolvens]